MTPIIEKKKKSIALFFGALVAAILASLVFASFLLSLSASAFTGPSSSAGVGGGAITTDGASNLAIGTSTTKSDTKLLVVGSSTASAAYALRVMDVTQGPILYARNDGSVAVATTSFGSTLTVQGTIYSTGNYSGNVSAANVLSGVFPSGNFAFQSSLGISTSTNVSLPQALSVYGNGYFSSAGTASSPTLQIGAADAGIYLPSSNQLGIVTGGSERIRIDSSGNFGIGNSSPTGIFQVSSSIIYASSATGKVGIGTTGPTSILHVKTTGGTSATIQAQSTNTASNSEFYAPADTAILDMNAFGSAYGGTLAGISRNSMVDLEAQSASNAFVISTVNGAVPIVFAPSRSEVMRITDAGNVGIGSTNPGSKLSVNGQVDVNSSKIVNLATPTASTDAATKGYVDAASTALTWKGFTGSSYNGNMGATAGMNAKCDAAYSGSHACTWDEIIRLGASYPATYNAWIVDGAYMDGATYEITKDGAGFNNFISSGCPTNTVLCDGWSSSAGSCYGPYNRAGGDVMNNATCDTTHPIPCCSGN